MDFLEYLAHSWGTKPEQKKREKEYNAKYYQEHKEKWGIKVPAVNDYQPYDTYKYVPSKREDLPEGMYPRTDAEEEQWAKQGIHYDPTTGRYYKVDSALTVDLGYARERGASRKNKERKRSNIARSSQDKAKNEAERLLKAKQNAYLNQKRREINEKTVKDAQKTNAKKAREFIDGYVEYTIDNVKKSRKKFEDSVKDFLGW